MDKDLKSLILYHRSYRRIPSAYQSMLWQICFLVVPLSAITIFFYPEITRIICLITERILSPLFLEGTVKIVEVDYIKAIGNISFVSLPGKYPSSYFSIINAIVCLVILLIVPRIENAKPIVIITIIIATLLFITASFFIIFPDEFPYNAVDYSRIYMMQQISIWFFVPLLTGIGVIPLPSTVKKKCCTLLITYIYSLIFGAIRYIVFLFILAKISLLYMTILFFLFGPLIDFVYIVGIYSIHTTSLANKIKGDFKLWKWQ